MTRTECREVAQGYYDEAELIGYEPTPYEKQLVRAVAAYELDDDDAYNAILARTAQRFHRSESRVEDDATDVRMFGLGCSDFD